MHGEYTLKVHLHKYTIVFISVTDCINKYLHMLFKKKCNIGVMIWETIEKEEVHF